MCVKLFSIWLVLLGIKIINAGFYIDEYYISYPLKLDWFAANRFCTYYNMNLVDVPNEKEYNRILNVINLVKMNTSAIGGESIWTSGTRLWDEPSYYWETNGQPLIYTNWYPGDPQYGNEKCIFLYHPGNYQIADVICDAKFVFMCRKGKINRLYEYNELQCD